jgi:two-component system, OmpR family, alkaline phosphatase synthesis response regulator PhoP
MNQKQYKLLIVDDEPEIGELLSYNFRKKGFDVMTALNGFSGFESVKSFHPDVIILDIMMPYVNGINLCKELKTDSRFKNIPVLFLSATNNKDLIQAAMDAGGQNFLSKPIHLNLLIETVVKMHHDSIQSTY